VRKSIFLWSFGELELKLGVIGAGSAELVICCGRGSCCVAPFRCRAMQCGVATPQVPFGTPPRSMRHKLPESLANMFAYRGVVLVLRLPAVSLDSLQSMTDQCRHVAARGVYAHCTGEAVVCFAAEQYAVPIYLPGPYAACLVSGG
jgi:hypothetical protein